ncbi:MFS transporter [Pseudomonas syringae]|uniref:MFS transporter n=1 Tax=Pseudomonas syringae TaxID=317 RepID=UPI000466F5F2|nr:MFS transporter [Pseudomonas syringae]
MDTPQHTVGFKVAVSLALITILGPSAIDMYLAAIPHMTRDLNTDYATMQLTLTVFLLAMGAGQLLFGQVIDTLGRRRPLLAGLVAVILASLSASFSESMDAMLLARFFQGLSVALLLVIAMSSVRDLYSGIRATQLFALPVALQGAAPILALAFGGTCVAMLLGAMTGSRAASKCSASLMALLGVAMMSGGSALALFTVFVGADLYGIVPAFFIAVFGFGIAEPSLMSIAMASQEQALGATAALLGASTHIPDSLATPLAGSLAQISAHAWLALLFVAALVGLTLVFISVRSVSNKVIAVH